MDYKNSKVFTIMSHSIEIDCPPGYPRPDVYFKQILEKTQMRPDWFITGVEPITTFYGNWRWELKPEFNQAYERVKPQVKQMVERFYHTGAIRYGSW